MVEASALLRCVCGGEIPLRGSEEISCPSCGRRHVPRAMREAMLETVVLAAGPAPPKSAAAPREASSNGQSLSGQCLSGQCLDHFQILEELGRGGIGTVYRALDKSLERYVAVKVLNGEADDWALEAFVHEARAQARLNHHGIATIYYIGRHGATPYFAMEYVQGKDLEHCIRGGPLPAGELIRIGIQAVRALREASAHGITHRDIKPGNFIQTPSGAIKLTDFGLSKTERGGLTLTGKRTITGTVYYIAPEQARGEKTDHRADIYSLGAMLYHLAFGKPPFEGDNFVAVIAKHASEPVRFPEPLPADLPAGFTALIEKMMAKDPAGRFGDYDSLERQMRQLLPESQVVATIARRMVTLALELVASALLAGLGDVVLTISREIVSDESAPIENATARLVSAWIFLATLLSLQLWRGRTPGKEFSHLRIAGIDGCNPGRGRLALRFVFQWLPLVYLGLSPVWGFVFAGRKASNVSLLAVFLLFLVDHFSAYTNRRRRTLHDLIAGTWVLEERLGPVPPA